MQIQSINVHINRSVKSTMWALMNTVMKFGFHKKMLVCCSTVNIHDYIALVPSVQQKSSGLKFSKS